MTDHDSASQPHRSGPLPTDSPELTDYDRAHLQVYIQLLDADAAGIPWQEVVRLISNLDPIADPATAKRSYDAHLARAQWMTRVGYQLLLEKP